jgi:hypothetical protein
MVEQYQAYFREKSTPLNARSHPFTFFDTGVE